MSLALTNGALLLLTEYKSQVLKGALSRIGAVQNQEPCQGREVVMIYYAPPLTHPRTPTPQPCINVVQLISALCCTVYAAEMMFLCCYSFGIHCRHNDFPTTLT